MIHIERKHTPGRFLCCSGCGREPRHVVGRGSLRGEPMRPGQRTERHQLECHPCGRSTGWMETLQHAEVEWGTRYAQLALPLPGKGRKAA